MHWMRSSSVQWAQEVTAERASARAAIYEICYLFRDCNCLSPRSPREGAQAVRWLLFLKQLVRQPVFGFILVQRRAIWSLHH